MSPSRTIRTSCCIVGGGPAGAVLGFLLARAGVDVVVLEKHGDFLRDFRGDTIHASTLELMAELGLLDDFLKLQHDEIDGVRVRVNGREFTFGDMKHLPTRCKFVALMPQWNFLDFITEKARRYPTFHLMMKSEVVDLVEQGGFVKGVVANTPEGPVTIDADLVVGCDGRHSVVREKAGFVAQQLPAPIDVLWLRIPKDKSLTGRALGYLESGRFMVLLDRTTYFQCGYVIPKGGYDGVRAAGLPAFRASIVRMAPFLAKLVEAVKSWDEVSLLSVTIDRLTRWHKPGLLCIGDAAHAMSPAGGVGINLAIQDAVAAANRLARPLLEGKLSERDLAAVQERRMWPVRVIQGAQVFVHQRFVNANTASPVQVPSYVPWLAHTFPVLQRIPAYLVAVGPRPEHVHTPEMASTPSGSARTPNERAARTPRAATPGTPDRTPPGPTRP